MKVSGIIICFLLFFSNISFAYENSIYIWQRSWRPEISESINRIAGLSDRFMVLAGDLKVENKRVTFSKVGVNWEYLRPKNNVTIDIRMRTDMSRLLKADDTSLIVDYLVSKINGIIEEAKQAGVQVVGIELDYDCPTSKLSDFARFVKNLRKTSGYRIFSITALPTWMQNKDFSPLIAAVDYYVLQLHSFELPKNQKVPQYIFPKDKAIEYLNQAIAFNRPFYLSLPTYGYEVAYNKDDEFIGLRAEGGVQYFADGIKRNMVFAKPAEIVDFLNFINKSTSANFKGVCWFRLPVSSDRFNWNIKTFERVLKKEIPQGHLRIEIVPNSNGVKEIYLVNDGEINFIEKISFDVLWNGKKPLYDVLGDFEYSNLENGSGIHLVGQAPRVSQRKMAAWFRASDMKEINILNSEVRDYEKN